MYRKTYLVGSFLSVVVALALFPSNSALADCSPDGTAGPDVIVCTGTDTNGVDGAAGNDTITIQSSATVTNTASAGIQDSSGNTTVTNFGTINGGNAGSGDGVNLGGSGNKTITNNGVVNGAQDGIDIDGTGNSYIENYGTVVGNSQSGIDGGNGNDTIINYGTVTGVTEAVDASSGDDQVTILVGSSVNGDINGGSDVDTLIFKLEGDQATINAFNAYITANGINVASGALTFGGHTYTWSNFEDLQFLLSLIVAGDVEGLASFAPSLQELCGLPLKVFRLPNGDLQVYAGFDTVPNGFLVGNISLAELANGTTRFQDRGEGALNPNWYVTVEVPQGIRYLVVYNQANREIGRCEF